MSERKKEVLSVLSLLMLPFMGGGLVFLIGCYEFHEKFRHHVQFEPPLENAHAYHVCSAYKWLAEDRYHVPVPWDWMVESTTLEGNFWVKGEWPDGRSSEPIYCEARGTPLEIVLRPKGQGSCSVSPEPEGKPLGSRTKTQKAERKS